MSDINSTLRFLNKDKEVSTEAPENNNQNANQVFGFVDNKIKPAETSKQEEAKKDELL